MKTPLRTAALLAATGLLITACSSTDDTGDDPGTAAPEAGDNNASEVDAPVDGETGSDGQGTVTIDGLTITFTPSLCLIGGGDVLFSGPGTTDTGEPAHVDSGDRTQLTVYMGVDDPFGDPDFLYENLGAGQDLDGLRIDGSTLTAQPEMHRVDADRTVFDEVGTADLEVSCG